jgi:hypothetical protein
MPLIPIAMALAQFAPAILKLVTGSDRAEEVATKIVNIATTVTGQPADQVVEALKADPAALITFQQAVMANEADLTKAFLLDTQSARARDVAINQSTGKNIRANWLITISITTVILILVICIWRNEELSEFIKGILSLALGRALGWVDQAQNFEFGTTRTSVKKDDTINNLTKG